MGRYESSVKFTVNEDNFAKYLNLRGALRGVNFKDFLQDRCPFTKSEIEKVPETAPTVYALYEDSEGLIYIGQSRKLQQRLKHHLCKYEQAHGVKPKWFAYKELWWLIDATLEFVETSCIQALSPKHNIKGKQLEGCFKELK